MDENLRKKLAALRALAEWRGTTEAEAMTKDAFTVHLCPPDYPRHLRPFACPHLPQFQMCADAHIIKGKIEIDSMLCMACGKPLSASYGGNVFTCITECLGADVGYNAKIATHLRYLSSRYLRIASKLFGEGGWTGRRRKWAELIDPNLTMRVVEVGSHADGTRFFQVFADESYFRPGEVNP